MDPPAQNKNRYSSLHLVITAAVGMKLDYDSSIWHFKYPLQDVKTQNIFKYLDEVGAKIDKGFVSVMQVSKKEVSWFTVGQESRGYKIFTNLVRNTRYRLSH